MEAANDTLAWIDQATMDDLLEVEHIANQSFTSGIEEPHNILQAILDNTEISEGVAEHLVAYGEHKDWEDLSLSEFKAFVRWKVVGVESE